MRRYKLLTIVLCGRNDDYLGDFKYRIQTAINYVGVSCAHRGLKNDVEILVVDWNSDEPLSQALLLLPDAYDICQYISVTPELVHKHAPSNRRFSPEIAANVGLRRASSDFILFCPADILCTETAIDNLVAILNNERQTTFDPQKTILCLDRKMLPWQIVEKKPTIEQWDRYIQLCGRHLIHDRYFLGLNGGYGGLLLHRNLWFECQGFAEHNSGWGLSDTDWGLRLGQKYLSVSLESLGVTLYDMQQRPDLTVRRKVGEMHYGNRIDLNQPDWGLASVEFEKTKGVLSEKIDFARKKLARPNQETALSLIQQASKQIVPTLPGAERLPVGSIEHVLLAALTWYCLTYWPSRYYEFNCHAGLSALAYAKLCTFGEIYAFDDYSEFDQAENFQSYLNALPNNHYYSLGFRGHDQLLTGDAATALDRLREAFPGEMEFDLAVLRCDALKTPERCMKMIDDLIEALSPNGALCITAQSKNLFNSFQKDLQKKHGQHEFISAQNQPFKMLIKQT